MEPARQQIASAAAVLTRIREQRPLVHNITNFVVMNDTANALMHIGAAPVMAHAPEEVEEMVALAGALVLNIGTLSREWLGAMIIAGRAANARNIPVILDPVGAGATRFRTESSLRLLEAVNVQILRGNPGEIATLAGISAQVRGVDSVAAAAGSREIARTAAAKFGLTAVVTGAEDVIADERGSLLVGNGHPLMAELTGTGCMASALIGAFAAANADPVVSALGALAGFGIAGEKAAVKAMVPGSFRVALMDELYLLTAEDILAGARVAGE